jgi:SAM-dependent methyltransferase
LRLRATAAALPTTNAWARVLNKLRKTLRASQDLRSIVAAMRRSKLRRARKRHFDEYLASTAVRKLQLGSGENILPGWLNTDAQSPRLYLDISQPFPFADATFDYIFCEHTIEHIHFNSAVSMLFECRRILRPGGKIRIATPNLASYLRLFEPQGGEIVCECIDEIFNDWILTGFHAAANYRPVNDAPSAVFVLNDLFRNYEHKFIYDAATLGDTLAHCGFSDIGVRDVGDSTDVNFRGLETHTSRVARFITMVVEARADEPAVAMTRDAQGGDAATGSVALQMLDSVAKIGVHGSTQMQSRRLLNSPRRFFAGRPSPRSPLC